MTVAKATQAAIGVGLVLMSSGAALSALGQSETTTVRERVVVTLPSGKRIVRTVEKQVPVASETLAAPTPAPTTGGGDPFSAPTGTGGGGGSGGGGEIDPRILEWIGWYQAGDMQADANGDGRISSADFNAYLMWLNEQDAGNDGTTGGSGDGSNNDGGTTDGGTTGDGSGTTGGTDGGSTNEPPAAETGWTTLTPSADSQVFYVAENGNDSNDGLSPSRPLRTVAEGVRRLRTGYPDWLLLRRGDTFSEVLSADWRKSGRSESEKMVISAYGEGPRPVLLTGTAKAFVVIRADRRAHVAITSLEFRPGVQYANYAISMVSPGVQDFLFEDLLVSNYTHGIALHGDTTGDMRDISIRRSLFLDQGGTTHAQGIFADKVDGLLIEQCIVDRCGWAPAQGRDATATIFAHNVYIQRTVKNLVFRDNFTSRASSHGIQARLGGIVERNVLWSNPIGIMFGNEGARSDEPAVQGRVNDNLIIEGIHQNTDNKRGWGIQIQHADGVEVMRNIVANSRVAAEDGYGLMLFSNRDADNRNLTIANNVIDDYGRNIRLDEDDTISTTIRDNIFSKTTGSRPLIQHDEAMTLPGLIYRGNRYMHRVQNDAFDLAGSRVDLNEWQADFDPTGGPLLDDYVDGDATLSDYARSVGFASEDAFIAAMRSQRKGNWDERLQSAAIRAYFRDAFRLRGSN